MTVITISRQSGSDGDLITQILCERLGYRYFDKKLMMQLCEEAELDAEQLVDASVDLHRVKGLLERLFGNIQLPFRDSAQLALSAQIDAQEALSVQQVRKLIDAAYELGDVVIVGRGGQVALAGKPDVLHVRVVAPLEMRIVRLKENGGLSTKSARERLHERDQAHVDFIRRFFHANVNDPALYDLVINTKKLSPQFAAETIIAALETLNASGEIQAL